ncbi:uncharacterized protein [Triticum aestivum]|uniref:uncharacterized protein n=1 Tax=Triticum aestivum TaxID=4565 RepID=UPI001D01F184|nr:uncharacterized protein LOC123138599 [Triticum aestivum]
MVLDLIRTISNDVNFVTIHDMEQHGTLLSSAVPIVCPCFFSFKVLRVLVIEDCVFPEGSCLEHLGKLVQLRYLGVVKTMVKIPEGIGHELKFLEILDVRAGLISELPPSVGELMNLRCLWADEGTVMKGEIGKLTCLEELELYSVEKCPNFSTDVGKLTKLRVLKIFFGDIEESAGKALMESLCNVHNIHSLTVVNDGDDLEYSVVFNHSLEDLEPCTKLYEVNMISIAIPRVPSWINHLSTPLLYQLWLRVDAVEARDVQTIGRLPSLLFLVLWSKDEKNISYTFSSNEFHKLRWLFTKKIEIAVGEGALPMLEGLGYSASAERKDAASFVPWRRNSCPLLKKVTCCLDCTNSSYREVEQTKEALRQAATTHPNAEDLDVNVEEENYDEAAGRLIDNLEWILRDLDVGRPAAYQEERTRRMIRSLERRLRDAAEPRVGRYGEQEIRDLVTKFKSWIRDLGRYGEQEIRDHAGTDLVEAGKSAVTDIEDNDDEDYYYDDDDAIDQAEDGGHLEGFYGLTVATWKTSAYFVNRVASANAIRSIYLQKKWNHNPAAEADYSTYTVLLPSIYRSQTVAVMTLRAAASNGNNISPSSYLAMLANFHSCTESLIHLPCSQQTTAPGSLNASFSFSLSTNTYRRLVPAQNRQHDKATCSRKP